MNMKFLKKIVQKRLHDYPNFVIKIDRGDVLCFYPNENSGLLYIAFRYRKDREMFYINILLQRPDGSEQLCLYIDNPPYLKKGLIPFGKGDNMYFAIDKDLEELIDKVIVNLGLYFDFDTGLFLEPGKSPI